MLHMPITKPLRIATMRLGERLALARDNSGALIIMEGDVGAEDCRRIATVEMTIKPKRGQGWNTTDLEQERIAQFIIDAVNAKLAMED